MTSAIAPSVTDSAFIFIVLLATLYGGELVWRERQIKADQLQDAMPVPVWVTFGGKLVAVFLAIVVLLVVATLGGDGRCKRRKATRASSRGCTRRSSASSRFPIALAIVALAMGVHAIVNQKFVGHLIIIAYWVIVAGAEQPRPRPSALSDRTAGRTSPTPTWPAGARIFRGSSRFGLYSVAVCLVLATLGYLVLVRGTDAGCGARAGTCAAQRWRSGGALAVGDASASPPIALGGVFFYNANMLNAYTEVRTAERRVKGVRERSTSRSTSLPQPRLVGVTLQHDYFPERRAAAWRGTLRAVNRERAPVDTLFISLPRDRADADEPVRGDVEQRARASTRWRSIATRR